MSRELRLAFAMGGGVSLGTFSGAALSEVLKLALLRGISPHVTNESNERYDRVVVDVFSGASAGAMTLGAMLATLSWRTPAQEQDARRQLIDEYGSEFLDQTDGRQLDLIAAQVVQNVQERLWGKEISLDRLLGENSDGRRDLRHVGGILDRGAVDDIAREVFTVPDPVDFEGRRLLGDRVLFAATLSNISPILFDARTDLQSTPAALLGLVDGMTSRVHRELRVFDLNFPAVSQRTLARQEIYPNRWIRYHTAEENEGKIGDLRRQRTWAKIGATAIASGAFPLAFEPVVLNRKRYEYDKKVWPFEDRTEYPFTYIDGGTFNNEPIREAFRLAYFMDAHSPHADFDRLIVFVDPNIQPLDGSYHVPIHQEYALKQPNFFGSLDGTDLIRRATLDRLVPHAGSLLSAIMNESRTIEGDKIYQMRDRFKLRNRVRKFINKALPDTPDEDLIQAVREECEVILANDVSNMAIPAGALTLAKELERVIAEEGGEFSVLKGKASTFLKASDTVEDEHASLWFRALIFVAVDLMADLEGKRPQSKLLAIGPIVRDTDGTGDRRIVDLPGRRIRGFGGFTSTSARQYEMKLAHYCVREIMEEEGTIADASKPNLLPSFGSSERANYRKELEAGLRSLGRRVEALTTQSHLLNVGPLNQAVLGLIANWVEKRIQGLGADEEKTQLYEFRIQVPDKRFELDGKGVGDRDLRALRVEENGPWQLVVYLRYNSASKKWQGTFVEEDKQMLRIDRDGVGLRRDRRFCDLTLPTPMQCVQADALPNPIFKARITPEDRDTTLEPDRWHEIDPGVGSLEDMLFPVEEKPVMPTDDDFIAASDGTTT